MILNFVSARFDGDTVFTKKQTLSSRLFCRLKRKDRFMYCPVVEIFPHFCFKMKGKQRSIRELCLTNTIVLNQVCVCHKSVYSTKTFSKNWFRRSSSSQYCFNVVVNKISKSVSQVCAKHCKSRCFLSKIKLNLLHFPRHFDSDTTFFVIASLLN